MRHPRRLQRRELERRAKLPPAAQLATAATGSGAPSGAHYSLNIIGVAKAKNPDMSGAGGNVIFVTLGSKDGAAVTTKIMLEQSAQAGEFAVLDKTAPMVRHRSRSPRPAATPIWARALGTPGGQAKITTSPPT